MAESLKQRIKSGELVKGTFLLFSGGVDFPVFLKGLGFDFFVLDLEHSWFDLAKTRETISAARGAGISCIVRIPEIQYHFVARILDAGADGIMLPRTETRLEAEKLVEFGRYRPQGKRGITTFAGHNDFKRPSDVPEFLAGKNRDIILMTQIETVQGVKNREKILSVPGIDACFIGPGDLAMGMGHAGNTNHKDVVREVRKVIDCARKRGLICSLPILSPDQIGFWIKAGLNMLTLGMDSLLFAAGASLFMKEAQKLLGEKAKSRRISPGE